LLTGHIAEAQQLLQAAIAATDQPADHLLLCRVFFAEDHFSDALPQCQAAADSPSPSSAAFLWLGRIQGARASRANPLVAFVIARKVHSAFARAVELNPASAAAVDDLGEYLVEAPAVVGGGVDLARTLAAQSMAATPSAAHRVLAQAAQHTGDSPAAEREFRAAVRMARHEELPGAWIDLARFFSQHGHPEDALAAIRSALAADPRHDAALVDAARLRLRLHQPPADAIALLRDYLNSPNQTDEAPSFKVHRQLANLFTRIGDTAAAEHEEAAARTLAPDFLPSPSPHRSDSSTGQVR